MTWPEHCSSEDGNRVIHQGYKWHMQTCVLWKKDFFLNKFFLRSCFVQRLKGLTKNTNEKVTFKSVNMALLSLHAGTCSRAQIRHTQPDAHPGTAAQESYKRGLSTLSVLYERTCHVQWYDFPADKTIRQQPHTACKAALSSFPVW